MGRAIVSKPGHLGGRYHLEGTNIAVAMIRGDLAAGEDVLELYANIKLTADEVESILSFDFPAMREPSLGDTVMPWILNCSCGEETLISDITHPCLDVMCICGRTWRVSARISQVDDVTFCPLVRGFPGLV
jgi:uncharacterized protein (DUF433 family)